MAYAGDELDFECDGSLASSNVSFTSSRDSRSSMSSIVFGNGKRRTRTARKRLREQEEASHGEEPPSSQSSSSSSQKVVRFSLSPSHSDQRESISSSLSSTSAVMSGTGGSYRQKRRKLASFAKSSSPASNDSSSVLSLPPFSRTSSVDSYDSFASASTTSNASSISTLDDMSSSSQRRMKRPPRSKQIAQDITTRPVRGARVDALAVQDAGSYRMLHDDCSYLCSTVTTSINKSQTSSTAADGACDLALLLSVQKTRAVLLSTVAATITKGPTKGEGTALAAILEVLACVPYPHHVPLDQFLQTSRDGIRTNSNGEHHENGGKSFTPLTNTVETSSSNTALLRRRGNRKTGRKKSSNKNPKDQQPESYDSSIGAGPLLEALSVVTHFLSWDCTTCDHSTSNSASAARNVRNVFLRHKGALRGISRLILQDPIVSGILDVCNNAGDAPLLASSTEGNDDSSTKDKMEALSSSEKDEPDGTAGMSDDDRKTPSVDNSIASGSPSSKGDPTSTGRRNRRKRRRIVLISRDSRPMLDPISELGEDCEGEAAPSSPEKKAFIVSHNGFGSQLSFTSDEVSTSSRLNPSQGSPCSRSSCADDDSSINSVSSQSAKIQSKLVKARARLVPADKVDNEMQPPSSSCSRCGCHPSSSYEKAEGDSSVNQVMPPPKPIHNIVPSSIALAAMSRIITGKEGDEVSCMEADHDGEDHYEEEIMDPDEDGNHGSEDNDEEHRRNPLLITNRLLRQSGSLPLLAQAMAETLAAVIQMIRDTKHGGGTICTGCIRHLQSRVSALATIIDGACCLTSENRRELCADVHGTGQAGPLVSSLLLLLKIVPAGTAAAGNGDTTVTSSVVSVLDDIALSALRTLTSLTHENNVVGEQLMLCYGVKPSDALSSTSQHLQRGVTILATLLFRSVRHEHRAHSKHCYDMIIFCLNTLTNVVDTQEVRKVLVELDVSDIDGATEDETKREEKLRFLTWLSRWLVSETESYRDAVMQGSFGEKSTQAHEVSSDRDLAKHEEEQLVTAGNGFILLACIMIESAADDIRPLGEDDDNEHVTSIRNLVLAEMPLKEDGSSTGVTLIRNTLKAFCNFYHYSVGDLSVAVVAPVRKLIQELDRM